MKKLLLATAIAALSVSAAQAAPTIYGKALVTADYVNIDGDYRYSESTGYTESGNADENTVEINSTGSKLGFKGSEAMTANTDVIYQLEYGLKVDGDDRTFKSRDTYLGFANKDFGQFRFGRNTSVLDYVNNVALTQGYWDNLGNNTLDFDEDDLDDLNDLNVVKALNMVSDERQDNSVVWIAPKYNGVPVQLALQYSADERFIDSNSGYGASLMFDQGTGFTAGLAYTKDMDTQGTQELYDAVDDYWYDRNYGGDVIRGTLTADLSKYTAYPVTLGALYQVADYDYAGSKKEKGLVVSGEMGLTNFAKPASVYLQYNKTDNLAGIDNFDSDQIVLGGKYMFKDNMIAHAYVGQNSGELSASYVDGTYSERASADIDVFALGGGLEYLF